MLKMWNFLSLQSVGTFRLQCNHPLRILLSMITKREFYRGYQSCCS